MKLLNQYNPSTLYSDLHVIVYARQDPNSKNVLIFITFINN